MEEAPSLPFGVVTFVLTDVVGSSHLWDTAPDAMRAALVLHDKAVREAIERHGGIVLKPRGEGDSTFSVFHRASDALRAAYDVQLDLGGEDWPLGAPISVRVAVHAGEASEADGDYVGTTVNRAARLRGVAAGGEIIVSATVANLAADHLPLDTALQPLGDVALRDLGRPEEAFVLTGAGLVATSGGPRGEPAVDALGGAGVTKRERDVFDAVADRLTNAEIAGRLSVSERTIETHVSALLRKLGAKNRIELAALAQQARQVSRPALPPMLAMAAQRSACVGRREERTLLLSCWERSARGQTELVLVRGEAGIGKSRLAAELAVEVHRRGGRVLLGACTSGAQVPYQPFVEALAEAVASAPEGQLRADIGGQVQPIARILPDVTRRLGVVPPAAGVDPFGERESSQESLVRLLTAMARRQPLLLVIEDLHWASSLTREVALGLARRGGTAPLLVVATARDTAPDLDAQLATWLAAAARLPVTTVVTLDGLSLEATADLFEHLGSSLDPAAAVETTGGNPLFLREMAASGPESPTLADLVSDRFARLSDDDLEIVDLAVVLDHGIRADLVAAATAKPVEDVVDAFERAREAGIVEPVDDRGLYMFSHALFAEVRRASLTSSRRLRLHAAVAAALSGRADDPTVLPHLARHACVAAPLGRADEAVAYAAAAGRLCASVGDRGQAAAHYRDALDVVDFSTEVDEHQRLELTIRFGEALVHADVERAHAVLRDAVRLARRLDDPRAFADAVCAMSPDFGSFSAGRDDPAFIALAEEALQRVGDAHPGWRARLLSTLGVHLALGSQAERGRELIREAVSIARASDPLDYVRAVLTLYYALGQFDNDERLDTLREALVICERSGHDTLTQIAATRVAGVYRSWADLEGMRRFLRAATECTPSRSLGLLQSEALDAFLAGDLQLAEERNRATHDAAVGMRVENLYSGSIEIQLAGWRCQPMPAFLELFADLPSFVGDAAQAALAFGHAQGLDLDRATAMLSDARRDGFAGVRRSMVRSVVLALWAEVASVARDSAAARDLFDLLEPLAGQIADGNGVIWCSIDHARAQLALTFGDADLAVSIATDAVAASRTRGTPLFLARELVVLAAAGAYGGASPMQVDPLIDEAMSIADATGAELVRWDIERFGLKKDAVQ